MAQRCHLELELLAEKYVFEVVKPLQLHRHREKRINRM